MDYPQYFATLRRIPTKMIRLPSGRIENGWDIFATSGDETNNVTHIRARRHGYHPIIEMTLDDFLAVNGIDITDLISG